MDTVRNKIDIIRKVLNEIESEDRFTDVFRTLPANSQRDFKDFSPEQIYFDLIKHIIVQDDLPTNVCGINIRMDNNNKMIGYELISLSLKAPGNKGYITITWEE